MTKKTEVNKAATEQATPEQATPEQATPEQAANLAATIIAETPIKPERDFTGLEDSEQAQELEKEFTQKIKDYNTERKEYKKDVLADLNKEERPVWLGVVHGMLNQRTGKPCAVDTAVSTWLKDIDSAFSAKFPGERLVPVKAATKIVGYEIQAKVSAQAEKLIKEITDIFGLYPELFQEDQTEQGIYNFIAEKEQYHAREIRHKEELTAIRRDYAAVKAELDGMTRKVNAAVADGFGVTEKHTADIAEQSAKLASLKEEEQKVLNAAF